MAPPPPPQLEQRGDNVQLSGSWKISFFESIDELKIEGQINSVDGSKIDFLDTAGALKLLSLFPNASLDNFSPENKALMDLVSERIHQSNGPQKFKKLSFIEEFGKFVVEIADNISGILVVLGEAIISLLSLPFKPSMFRPKEFASQLQAACIKGIPIIALVTALIGVVVAYLFASQAQKFGAYIFIVEAVSIAMSRELSPVIAAIIVAARSGSAYTAQLGAMKLNHEIDAIKVLGLSPFAVLILPRILALVIAMPLLVFIGDLAGVFGGLFVADVYLGITPTTFFERLQRTLALKHVNIGLVKAPVFALVIAVIGCRFGFDTASDARSVGLSTTASVVYSVVAIIILDAAFAIFFQEMGW